MKQPVERNVCRGSAHPLARFSDAQIRRIRAKLAKGVENKTEYARELDISLTALYRIQKGTSYANVK